MSVDIPEPSFSVDLRGLAATLEVGADGEPVLVVGDDQGAIAFETGAGGTYEDAIDHAEHLVERLAMFIAVMKVRRGDRAPLKVTNPSPAEMQWWLDVVQERNQPPINGTQPIR